MLATDTPAALLMVRRNNNSSSAIAACGHSNASIIVATKGHSLKLVFILSSQVVDFLKHLVGSLHNARIRFVTALRHDHLHKFLDYVHIRLFKR